MYLFVTFPVVNSAAVVYSNWLADGDGIKWSHATSSANHQRLLLYTEELLHSTPTFGFLGAYNSGIAYFTSNLIWITSKIQFRFTEGFWLNLTKP